MFCALLEYFKAERPLYITRHTRVKTPAFYNFYMRISIDPHKVTVFLKKN